MMQSSNFRDCGANSARFFHFKFFIRRLFQPLKLYPLEGRHCGLGMNTDEDSHRGIINFFLGGQIFYLFFNATGLLKNWKKQHFICGNLALFIVPFIFFLFFFFFFFFLFFLSFFLFPWGATTPQPLSKMMPLDSQLHLSTLSSLSANVSCIRYKFSHSVFQGWLPI